MTVSKPEARSSPFGSRLIILAVASIIAAIAVLIGAGFNPWNVLFVDPLINVLILFNNIFFNQFGIAIIAFTILMRLVTLPLTVRQFKSTQAMQSIQPRMQELQKKYKDPKRRQEETIKLYREAGVNPAGCLLPMLVQLPIWIALYRALIIMVGGTPESQASLSGHLYPWSYLNQAVPLEQSFLWLDLGQSDSTFLLPILVGVTTYVQQKLTTTSTTPTTPQQQQMTSMMNWMMPLMFVWITISVPSGLGIYWVISNLASFLISIFVYGRKFNWRQVFIPLPSPPANQPKPAEAKAKVARPEEDDREEKKEEEIIEAEATPAPVTKSPREKRSSHGRRRRRRDRRKDGR